MYKTEDTEAASGQPDQLVYCDLWYSNYAGARSAGLATSFAVVIINIIICLVFQSISRMEKHHTQNDETLSQFQKIMTLQFINYALVPLLVYFSLEAMQATPPAL